MTDQQKEFLELCVVKQLNYDTIALKLDVPKKTLSQWYDTDLRKERIEMAMARSIWVRKKIGIPFNDFYQWYQKLEKKCFYCGITEPEIELMYQQGLLKTKHPTRGHKLELDRKNPEMEYSVLDNIVHACYWCNNAKMDSFTGEDFKEIGQAIRNIWNKRLGK